MAILLARSGLTVSAWDIEEASLNELVTEIGATGGAVKGLLVDLVDQNAIDAAWDDASSMGLPIPYLVNNAGPPSTTNVSVEGLRLAVGSYVAVTEGMAGASCRRCEQHDLYVFGGRQLLRRSDH